MLHPVVSICPHLGHLRRLGRYCRLLTGPRLPLTPGTRPPRPWHRPHPRGLVRNRHWHRVLPGLPANILGGILQTEIFVSMC